jgi:predicted metal-binding protein
MRPTSARPIAQVFVCTNARAPDDPLRSGCGAAGPALFAALKRRVIDGGVAARVWVTATGCQGHCPRAGCAVTLHPKNEHLIEAAEPDAPDILRAALTPRQAPQ